MAVKTSFITRMSMTLQMTFSSIAAGIWFFSIPLRWSQWVATRRSECGETGGQHTSVRLWNVCVTARCISSPTVVKNVLSSSAVRPSGWGRSFLVPPLDVAEVVMPDVPFHLGVQHRISLRVVTITITLTCTALLYFHTLCFASNFPSWGWRLMPVMTLFCFALSLTH